MVPYPHCMVDEADVKNSMIKTNEDDVRPLIDDKDDAISPLNDG